MSFLKHLCQYSWAKLIIKEHIERNVSLLAPYHNFNHALVVTENVHLAAKYYNIPEKELICAALWHDFNHSQGTQTDKVNVTLAIIEFLEWYEKHPEFHLEIDHNTVVNIISATEYPYVIDAKDLTLEQKIIRDADLLQYLEKNRFSQVYLGLSKEMNTPLLNLVEKAPIFINSVVPNTDWMRQQWLDNRQEILEEFELIKEIYETK
jgi:hypothetical protein